LRHYQRTYSLKAGHAKSLARWLVIKRGREDQRWYYESLAREFGKDKKLKNSSLYAEFNKIVHEVFI